VLSKWGGDTCVGPAFLAGAPNASVNRKVGGTPLFRLTEALFRHSVALFRLTVALFRHTEALFMLVYSARSSQCGSVR
jgi:hypothetical protein